MARRGDAPLRLYADGIWDLFHFGHANALRQAKLAFPHVTLIVGCCTDADTHRWKGKTVMTQAERCESLAHCRWVDEVIPDAPWCATDELLAAHDIDLVCHDAAPYVDTSGLSEGGDCYEHLRKKGKFHETQRTPGVSTTELITRVLGSFEEFAARNLARGESPQELNLSGVRAFLEAQYAGGASAPAASACSEQTGAVAQP